MILIRSHPNGGDGAAQELAREWLMRAGKRWRPFLTASVVQSIFLVIAIDALFSIFFAEMGI